MKVIRIAEVPKEDATESPIFFGGTVSRQDLVTDKTSEFFNFSVVNFDAGARNKFHTHTSDQILLVTQGKGHCCHPGGGTRCDGGHHHPHSQGRDPLARRH